ncbi:MAG: nucleotide exchange factor GrpE [Bacilli bacterium]|nr:nucleotide exchange factor GrpE [Bacilli bacterium]
MIEEVKQEDIDQEDQAEGEEVEANNSSSKKFSRREKKYKQQISLLEAEIEKTKKEADSWKNKYYQAYADLDNTRKNLQRDHDTMVKYRAQGFVEKLLPAFDSFQMAFAVEPKDENVKNYVQGFKMIYSQFEQAMKDEQISFVNPQVGDDFDSSYMHAIQTVDGEEDNKVANVYVRGYKLKDRLIRPAMVIVTKKKEAKADEDKLEESEEKKESADEKETDSDEKESK